MPAGPIKPPETDKRTEDRPPEREREKPTRAMRQLREQIAELYQNIGLMLVTPIDRLGGVLLVKRADDLADAWIQLAETDPKVRAALQRLVSAGGWGAVVIAHASVVLPVLVNRGALPDPIANGIAASVVMADNDLARFFTHPRFQEQQAGTPGETSSSENGDGS